MPDIAMIAAPALKITEPMKTAGFLPSRSVIGLPCI
jgi:hypothetical protein